MELMIDKNNTTIENLKRRVCNDIISRIISINTETRDKYIKIKFDDCYRTIHKGYIEIYGLGKLVIPSDLIVDGDYDAFLDTTILDEKLFSILYGLNMMELFTVCEEYSYSMEESTDEIHVPKYTIVHDSFNELKNMLVAKTAEKLNITI